MTSDVAVAPLRLADYDAARYGPILGVSDEGSAVDEVVRAARASAKANAANSSGAEVIGLIVDGERMTSGGEAPIGPDQYHAIGSAVANTAAAYCTTNVGIRVNSRVDRPFPELDIASGSGASELADSIVTVFEPFVNTPDGRPRPLLVRLTIRAADITPAVAEDVRTLVAEVETRRAAGRIGPADTHRLGVLVVFFDPIEPSHAPMIESLVELAARLRISEVAVDGPLLPAAKARMGAQGVLNLLAPDLANHLLAFAAGKEVEITTRYTYDEMSAAVGVWTGMQTADRFGFAGAKYGLAPLTFAEQEVVVAAIQSWAEITAIPAFYADTPFVAPDRVYLSDDAATALRLWLPMVAGHSARFVLVDCPDRITPRIDQPGSQGARPLVKSSAAPHGVFTVNQIAELTAFARDLEVEVLWSGGITRRAAFDLGARRVFGIFTTSSTARRIAVGGALISDPQLATDNEPDYHGVRQVHALLQAGFLSSTLADSDLAADIEGAAAPLFDLTATDAGLPPLIDDLNRLLERGWATHWSTESR